MELQQWYERLFARFEDGAIDRRLFLGMLGNAAAACGIIGSGMTGFAGPARAATRALRVDAFGGLSQKALNDLVFQPFTKETGVTINQGTFGETDQLLAKLQADPPGTYNAFAASDPMFVYRFQELGLIAELDDKKIPRLAELIDRPVREYRSFSRNGSVAGVPNALSGRWIGYNADKISRDEVEASGAAILLDPKYKGQIISENEWSRRIWYAALQTKQDPNAIKDMDAIWDKIRESKPFVKKFWTSASECTTLFKNGEAVVGDTRLSVVQGLKADGLHYEGWPKNGINIGFLSMAVFKDSPMDLFYEMIDVLLRPEVLVPMAVMTGNLTLIKPSLITPPKAFTELPGYDPAGKMETGYNTLDPVYWSIHAEEWQRRYEQVMARG